MASADRLVVALLAAGRSRRFGTEDKLLAPLRGKPLLHWAAEAGRAIDAAQHFIVAGPDLAQQALPDGYDLLVNPVPQQGLASSLRIAAHQARTLGASALLILLGDMPLVTPVHLRSLLAIHQRDGARPVFSRSGTQAAQPPALFPARLFPELESLSGDSGARAFAADARFAEAAANVLADVDTPEDLARCSNLLRS
ncbi:MAG: nucleotidyltransferase family protein [Sphingobium sp.]|nr:nucleotidyltransferase family protein [Sphingobium sp.]